MRHMVAVLPAVAIILIHACYRLTSIDWCFALHLWRECRSLAVYGYTYCPDYWSLTHHATGWEKIIFWIVMSAVYVLISLRLFKTMRRVRAYRLRLSECYKRISRTFRWQFRVNRDQHVDETYQKLRLGFAGNFLSKVVAVCVIYCLAASMNLFVRPRFRKPMEADFFSGSDLSFAALLSIPFISLDLARSYWTPATLDSLNVVLSSMWICRFFTMRPKWVLYWGGPHWVIRILQGIACGNPWLSLVLQSLVTAADVYASYRNCLPMPSVYEHRDPSLDVLAKYATANMFILLLVGCIFFSFRHAMWSTAQALDEALRSTNANVSAQRLLAGMCDAVVTLDSEFNLVSPCPKLAGLLLRPSIGDPNITRRFLDLMSSEDQDRFTRFLTDEAASQKTSHANLTESPPARLLHATLYDVHQAPVQVELFSSFNVYGNPHGPCHLVGIIAATTDTPSAHPCTSEDVIQSVERMYPTICEATISSPSDVTCSSFSSLATLYQDVQQNCTVDQVATVVIDTRTEAYEIVQCSSTFANLGGASSPGYTLSEWFPSSESWARFDGLIQSLVESVVRSGGTRTETLDDVFLTPPNLDGSIRIECICSATVENRDVFADGSGHANIVFSNFRPRVGRRKGKVRKRHSSAAKRKDAQVATKCWGKQVSTPQSDENPVITRSTLRL